MRHASTAGFSQGSLTSEIQERDRVEEPQLMHLHMNTAYIDRNADNGWRILLLGIPITVQIHAEEHVRKKEEERVRE